MIAFDDILREDARSRWAAEGLDPAEFMSLGRRIHAALTAGDAGVRPAAWGWLDLVRRGAFPARAAQHGGPAEWWPLILDLIDASEFTLARLLSQRAESYGPRSLFLLPAPSGLTTVTWRETTQRVDAIARGLLALNRERGARPIVFISENRLEMALADLACLTTGILDVMCPASLGDADVADVLARLEPGVVFVSGPELAQRLERLRQAAPSIHTVIDFDDPHPAAPGALGLPQLMALGESTALDELARARDAVKLTDLATVMFTSGTTGRPKGIRFSVRNLVTKRFARGLALPGIGERDVFLSYLPLCHTFGRYLEMLGCIYWGATYALLRDPSLESLLDGFQQIRPTVFISVPQRWIQLHDEVSRRVDLDRAPVEKIRDVVQQVTGGRLRWGLSAAGHLSATVFRFFQVNGVELLSGFGMTEATGGITMTPPGDYRDDSLGVPLPGIEVRLREDGELEIRGPYVMQGYFGEADPGVDAEGWMASGDLFERDADGHHRLVDRKKEIYKNSKGQTVAPQRVENLFRDFPAIRRVFLAGDHREYNTLLIAPDPEFAASTLAGLSLDDQRDIFRNMVASVNRFLAPFERIVDFAILDRDFSEERGELTRKGTFRRPQIVANFREVIEAMYRRVRLPIGEGGPGLIFPNWLFQALALTAGDIRVVDGRLRAAPSGASLTIAAETHDEDGWQARVGACRYRVQGDAVDLGLLVTCPELWLGNDELNQFAPLGPSTRMRRLRRPPDIVLLGRAAPYVAALGDAHKLEAGVVAAKLTIELVDRAARALGSVDERLAFLGLEVLRRAAAAPDHIPPELARQALRSGAMAPSHLTRREALRTLWPLERDEAARGTLARFLDAGPDLLDDATTTAIAAENFSEEKYEALLEVLRDGAADAAGRFAPHLPGLMTLLTRHGADHPGRCKRLRWALAYVEAHSPRPQDRAAARAARAELTRAFRRWLGEPARIAVDPETGREYRWEDVVSFAFGVDDADRTRLMAAIRDTSLLREAIFLFSGGATVRLNDIASHGVRIFLASRSPGRRVFRVAVETRYYGEFEFAVVVNETLAPEEVDEELLWLILTGAPLHGERLAPEFGGWWPEHGLWTQEAVVGETLTRALERMAAGDESEGAVRLAALGPFLIWTAAEAYFEFWARTGRQFVLARPSPDQVIVPTHDYQIGPRLTRVADRRAYSGPRDLFDALAAGLLAPLAGRRPDLAATGRRLLASALLEVVGVEAGLSLLDEAAAEDESHAAELRAFTAEVRNRGFVDRRLFFAIERYRRWHALAPDATREARAFTIRQLRETYQLIRSYERTPESRARYFRETVLATADGPLGQGLDELIEKLARREVKEDQLPELIDNLRRRAAPGTDDEYFLVRLSWPHVRPGDAAEFVSLERGGVRQSDVVITRTDAQNRPFLIRRPLSPREVGDLQRLFLGARLPVNFRPDHQFLVALDLSGRLIGGLFYELDEASREAYLEKIVVAESRRRGGVSQALMQEFLQRMQASGVRLVTTGYFRPEYFVHFGFRVDRAYGGQVRLLEESMDRV